MSENLNRSNQDFSKYDSMSIGELEEILRTDAMGPERDDSDVDEILYVMEVLAKKRRQNGIAGKTALEAYQEFQQHYLPRPVAESKPRRKANIIPFKRIAAVAASLVLVFSLATSANAFCFKDVWNAVVTWAQETFCFSTGAEVSEPDTDNELDYRSLQDVLSRNEITNTLVPTWIPERFELIDITVEESPLQEVYLAIYMDTEQTLRISIKSFLGAEPEQIEKSSNLTEIYHHNGTDYYLFSNHDQVQAVWINNTFECYISGKVSIEEIKMMIDSIGKG